MQVINDVLISQTVSFSLPKSENMLSLVITAQIELLILRLERKLILRCCPGMSDLQVSLG